MRLQLATWPEVDEYLKTSKGIIMPIGSTEQHGPTGLVGTDALTAEAISERLGEKIDAYVAPTISVGMAQKQISGGGPGSKSGAYIKKRFVFRNEEAGVEATERPTNNGF